MWRAALGFLSQRVSTFGDKSPKVRWRREAAEGETLPPVRDLLVQCEPVGKISPSLRATFPLGGIWAKMRMLLPPLGEELRAGCDCPAPQGEES